MVTIRVAALGHGVGEPRYEPSVTAMLSGARHGWLLVGLLLVGVVPTLQAARWLWLMRCRGLDPGYGQSLRLTLVGMFFNFSLPGMTGGDVVKAYYAAKGSGRHAVAVMSVVFDRIAGLMGLVVLAAVAGLLVLDEPLAARVTVGVWVALLALLLGGHLYLSRRLRRWLAPVSRAMTKLTPTRVLKRVDDAAAAYRDHLPVVYGAGALSLPVHVAQMTATGLAGQALGMDTSLVLLIAVLPVVFFAGAMPISYQGLGVMEAVALAPLPRDAYAVCTKVGTRPGMERDLSAEGVRRSVEQSLEALRVEHLDVLLIHDPSDIEDALAPGAALDEMQRLKQEGLTRYIGLGCRSHAFHRRAIETGRLDALLTYKDYTLLDQSALHDTIPLALQWGVGLMLASPLDMGALTGIEPDAQKHPRAHAMWQWCAARGVSLPALALQFCLSLPVNGGVLTGPATAAEVDASVKAATEPIDEATWDAFAEAFDVRRCFEPAALRLPGDGA